MLVISFQLQYFKTVIDPFRTAGFGIVAFQFKALSIALMVDQPYLWYDGTEVEFTNWLPSEPKDINGNNNCVRAVRSAPSFPWGDTNCNDAYPYVCKAPQSTLRISEI